MVDVVVLLLLVFSEGNATGKKIVKTGKVVYIETSCSKAFSLIKQNIDFRIEIKII